MTGEFEITVLGPMSDEELLQTEMSLRASILEPESYVPAIPMSGLTIPEKEEMLGVDPQADSWSQVSADVSISNGPGEVIAVSGADQLVMETNPVPEPLSVMLFGSGTAVVLRRRKKKR